MLVSPIFCRNPVRMFLIHFHLFI